jgi:phage terminase large subunit-like protein
MFKATAVVAALVLATASGGPVASPLPDRDAIERKVRTGLVGVPWVADAEVIVKRGAGGVLSRWVVAVACKACSGDAAEVDLIVVGLDREGRVHCAVPEGAHVCAEPIGGAVTSQTIAFRLHDGRKLAVEEQFHSGGAEGGRVFSVSARPAVSRTHATD